MTNLMKLFAKATAGLVLASALAVGFAGIASASAYGRTSVRVTNYYDYDGGFHYRRHYRFMPYHWYRYQNWYPYNWYYKYHNYYRW